MIIENSLLKEKVTGMQERFLRIEDKRESFIKELQDQITNKEIEATKNDNRQKNSKQLQKQL